MPRTRAPKRYDLPGVGVAREGEVHADAGGLVEEVRVVHQQQDRLLLASPVQRRGEIREALGQVVDAGEPQALAAPLDAASRVQEDRHAVLLQAVAPDPQVGVRVVVVVARNRVDAKRRS